MKTLKVKAFLASELTNDKAIEKVYNEYQNWNVENSSWYEFLFENFVERAKSEGFEIEVNTVGKRKEYSINFSGFYSQGDGLSFTGDIDTDKFFKGKDKKLVKFIDSLKIVRTSYQYSHHKTCETQYDLYGNCTDKQAERIDSIVERIEEKRVELCKEFYKELESTYEALTTKETVFETLDANEIYFDANGNRLDLDEAEEINED